MIEFIPQTIPRLFISVFFSLIYLNAEVWIISLGNRQTADLSTLRRRFIKDQEQSRIYFAKRELRKKRALEVKIMS